MTSGLREQHKQQTRAAISAAATRLFIERGFDQVTITHVAEAAGVAKMTVTNYFPRKEDLVFDQADAVIGAACRGQSAAGRRARATWRRSAAPISLSGPVRTARLGITSARRSPAMIRRSPALAARGAGDRLCAGAGARRRDRGSGDRHRLSRSCAWSPLSSRPRTGCSMPRRPGAAWPASHGTAPVRRLAR